MMNRNKVFVVATAEDRAQIAGKIHDREFKAECVNNGSCPSDCGVCDCQGCDDCACFGDCGVCH